MTKHMEDDKALQSPLRWSTSRWSFAINRSDSFARLSA